MDSCGKSSAQSQRHLAKLLKDGLERKSAWLGHGSPICSPPCRLNVSSVRLVGCSHLSEPHCHGLFLAVTRPACWPYEIGGEL